MEEVEIVDTRKTEIDFGVDDGTGLVVKIDSNLPDSHVIQSEANLVTFQGD